MERCGTEALIDWTSDNPDAGDVIPAADGARKVRWSRPEMGKRGGVRVIYFHLTADEIVLLVMMYAKAAQANVKPKDIKRGGEAMKTLKKLDVNKVVRAIEDDAGHALPGLLESLAQAKAGSFSRVHTPEKIVARRRGRPVGSKQEVTKEPVKIRLDADVMAALRESGDGWQTRINDALRASLALTGKSLPYSQVPYPITHDFVARGNTQDLGFRLRCLMGSTE